MLRCPRGRVIVRRDEDETSRGVVEVPESYRRSHARFSGVVLAAGDRWCPECREHHEPEFGVGDRVYFERARVELDLDGYGQVAVLYHEHIWGVDDASLGPEQVVEREMEAPE